MLMAISQRVVCKLELYDKPSKIMMMAGGGGGGGGGGGARIIKL